MTDVLLSILIPTVVGREEQLMKLIGSILGYNLPVNEFENDYIDIEHISSSRGTIQVVYISDSKFMTIGEKREQLYQKSKGLFSLQIDDDDELSPNAIKLILEVIKSNPEVDCITFEEHIDIDGKIERSNHSLAYGDWEGEGGKELWDGFHYHRTPFMKSVIRTDIARSIPIPHIRFGEDHQWAQALKPHLKTEVHISEQLYRYIHRSSNPTERYGFDRE